MNENEMLNATPVEVDEVTTPAVADEAAEAVETAPEVETAEVDTEPAEADGVAPEAVPAPTDEGVDEEPVEENRPRAARRSDDDLQIGAFIDDGNDMLKVDMPEDRRARDLAEMRRCVADNKRNPAAFCKARSSASALLALAALLLRSLVARCA